MAVDLSELVPAFKRAVNPPGEEVFPGTSNGEWANRLADAFWDARLNGFFTGYHEADGAVIYTDDPENTDQDLPRLEQEIILLHARSRTIRLQLLNLKTAVRQKAGPVSQEIERSANLLVQLAKELSEEIKRIRTELGERGASASTVAFIDLVALRHEQYATGWPYTT